MREETKTIIELIKNNKAKQAKFYNLTGDELELLIESLKQNHSLIILDIGRKIN